MLCSLQAYEGITLGKAGARQDKTDYNLLIGTLQLNLGTGTRFFWDSNFNRTGSNEESVFAVSPLLSIEAYWPISTYVIISTGITIGYEFYLTGNVDSNGLTISGIDEFATSNFDVDFVLRDDSVITLSNEFSVNIASASIQITDEQNNQQRQEQPFRSFNSVSLLEYTQVLTPITATSFGYIFANTFTRDVTTNANTAFNNSLDSQTHSLFAELETQINNALELSLQGTLSSTTYSEDFRNDFEQYEFGPRITYVSESGLSTSVYLGINFLEFDNTNSPVTQDNESQGLIFESFVSFATGNYLNHVLGLNYKRTPSQATTANPENLEEAIPANFQDVTRVTYRLNYLIRKRMNVILFYGLSQIKESDGGNQFFRETISARIPFQLNERTTIATDYTYSNVFGSEFNEFNNQRHLVEVTFRLNF